MNIIARILQKLLPREDEFYHVLTGLAKLAAQSSTALLHFVMSGKVGKFDDTLVREISGYRVAAKTMCDNFSHDLGRSFITPFDREDMLEIATALYSVIKLIDKIKTRMQRGNVVERDDDFERMLQIMQQQIAILQDVISNLNSNKMEETQAASKKLSDLERASDELLEQLTADLCKGGIEMREAFMRKDIYEMFERLSDACRDAGTVSEQIVLKHN